MQINSLDKLPALRLTLDGPDGKALSLRDGQQLTAMVRQVGPDGSLNLEISGRLLEARSTLRLLQGMVLQLRVEREQGQILLRIDPQQLKQLSQDQAMRHTLPRQEALKPLFEQLQQAGIRPQTANAPTTAGAAGTAPPGIQQAVSQLLAQLPPLQRALSPEGLQQVIAQSGLFLEYRLLNPQPGNPIKGDLKSILLRIANLIRQSLASGPPTPAAQTAQSGARTAMPPLPPQQLLALLKQTESSVARIQLNQLSALATQTRSEERLLNLELPLLLHKDREPEMLRLQIRREQRRGSEGEQAVWSVRLQLEPEGHGHIEAIVTLLGGKVSTTFWCRQQSTSILFARHMEELITRFREQGLEPGNCRTIFGEAPAENPPVYQANTLIDIQA